MVAGNNQKRGQALEESLAWLHGHYWTHYLARVYHHGTQAENRKGQWTPKKSLPDYGGILTCNHGQAVYFDAKRCTTPAYRHPKDKLHQTDFLYHADQAGAIAFLLIVNDTDSFEGEEGWIAFPTDAWRLENGKGFTIKCGEAHSNTIRCPGWDRVSHGYIPDWLVGLTQVYSFFHAIDADK